MEIEDATDAYIGKIISECEGRDWVNTGNTTSHYDSMFAATKRYLSNPRLMLEHKGLDFWRTNFDGGDRISDILGYYRTTGGELAALLMRLAFDAATEEELKDFSIYARHYQVKAEAARRYGELHKELRYLPQRLEGGFSRMPCWVAA